MRQLLIPLVAVCLFAPAVYAQDRTRTKAIEPPAKRSELDQLREEVRVLSERVKALEQQIAELKNELARTAPKPADRVADAMKRGVLAIGMTLEQVQQLTRAKGELLTESENGRRYKWVLSNSVRVTENTTAERFGSYTLLCDFADGKLTQFRRIDNLDRQN